jgi:hypothetical protein
MKRLLLPAWLMIVTVIPAKAFAGITVPNPDDYDRNLCATAQRLIVNAGEDDFLIETLRGTGNGFHTIQMDTSAEAHKVTVAAAADTIDADGVALTASVACKMVDRERINDVLDITLQGPEHSCADINKHTYDLALSALSDAERSKYLSSGRQLVFGPDYLTASGGEWLPAQVEQFIEPRTDKTDIYLLVRAPSVRVPWNPRSRKFHEGTQHCKLITMATMLRWMRVAAFTNSDKLFPRDALVCTSPTSMTSVSGSCLFWFAPAQAMFCEDYSGKTWDASAAQAECAKRHASAEALQLAGNKYAGLGGIYSSDSCGERNDSEPLTGTCVFHCNAPDEILWHTLGIQSSNPAAGTMMNKACDLFIPAE